MRNPVFWLIAGEACLIPVGLSWAWLRGIPVVSQFHTEAIGTALLFTTGLVLANFSLYRLGKKYGRPAGVLSFLENDLFPILRTASIGEVVLLASFAGLGEELLFRGVLQHEIGLWGASAIFGILHGPSRTLWPLALWASVIGALFGIVYQAGQNLAVVALTHAIYDGVAIFYFRLNMKNQK